MPTAKDPKPRPRKIGRPSKFTDEVKAKILEALQGGNYIETSAAYAGISKHTFYGWMEKGTTERDRLLADPEAVPDPDLVPFVDFVDAVERAKAETEVQAVAIIRKAAFTQWQAAAWWLERTRPRQYARMEKAEITGADGGALRVDVSTEQLERQVNKILEARSR